MPGLSPCTRREFIRKLRRLGYAGPYGGGRHAHMERTARAVVAGEPVVIVPNTDLSVGLLARVLRQAQINRDDFINA